MALARAGELGATAPIVNGRRKNAEIKCQYSAGDEFGERAGVSPNEAGRAEGSLVTGRVAMDGFLMGISAGDCSTERFHVRRKLRDAKHNEGNPCGIKVGWY
jgi:hypothetical protein